MRIEWILYVFEWFGIEWVCFICLFFVRQRIFKIGCVVIVLMGLCSVQIFRKIIKIIRNVIYQLVFYFDCKNNNFDFFDCQDDESLLMFYFKKNFCLLVYGNGNLDCFEMVVVEYCSN